MQDRENLKRTIAIAEMEGVIKKTLSLEIVSEFCLISKELFKLFHITGKDRNFPAIFCDPYITLIIKPHRQYSK